MTQETDPYYQPWNQPLPGTPSSAPRTIAPQPGQSPLTNGDADRHVGDQAERRVRDAPPPLGLDIAALPLPDADTEMARQSTASLSQRTGAAIGAASAATARGLGHGRQGGASLARATGRALTAVAAATRRGALAFADGTIALGARADVPARVAALQIPARSAALAGAAGGAIATVSGRTGRVVANAAARGWQALALPRRLGALGDHLGAAGRRTTDRLAQQVETWRHPHAAQDEAAVPPSGLSRLVAEDAASSAPPALVDLPLFAPDDGAPKTPPASAATAAPPPPVATPPQPAPATAPPRAAPREAGAGGAGAGGAGAGGPMVPRRWLAWAMGGTALAMLAAFWLGTWLAAPSAPGAALDPAMIDERVRAYILANPAIIPEAIEAQRAQALAGAIDGVRPLLEKPFAGAWIGNPDGDVTITLFTDYACVFCRASVPDVDRLVREDKRVKIVFRELPIIAPASRDAAIAGLRAARQGKYDAFHHAMFAAGDLGPDAIAAASTRAGVILSDRADATADDRLFEQEIENNMGIARQLGLNATPSWIIGDQLVQGAVGYAELTAAVSAAQAAKGG